MKITFRIALLVSLVSSSLAAGTAEDALNKLRNSSDNEAAKAELLQEVRKDPKALSLALGEAFNKNNSTVHRCALADVISRTGDERAQKALAGLLKGAESDLSICVAQYSGENKNEHALDALSDNVEGFLYGADKGLAEKDLKKKIAAINSIWAMGEIGAPKVMDKLQSFYNSSDEVLRINIIFSMSKLKTKKVVPYLQKLAENENETDGVRSAAAEILEKVEKRGK